jgi:uncharacterized phage protein (TIGR01671 family)
MRTIKFRAWDGKNKYILDCSYGNWISFDGVLYEEANLKYNTPNTEIEKSKDLTLMQFTGLQDKNGKEIYEGDILKGNSKTRKSVVTFAEGIFWANYGNGQLELSILLDPEKEVQVIGNIYQNPELL